MEQEFSIEITTVHESFKDSWGNVSKKIVFYRYTATDCDTGLEIMFFEERVETECENCHVDSVY